MSVDADFTQRLRGVACTATVTSTPADQRKAVLAVLRNAEDAEDAAVLLQALGLMDAAEELWRERRETRR